MNKIGVHFGYFNRDWNTDFVKQIETIKRIGLDILEVAPAPLMALTKQQRDEIAAAARDNEIDLTFSVGLGLDQDLASEDENIRKNGIKFTTDTFKIMSEMGGKMYSGVDIAAWNKTFTEGVTDKSASLYQTIDLFLKDMIEVQNSFKKIVNKRNYEISRRQRNHFCSRSSKPLRIFSCEYC